MPTQTSTCHQTANIARIMSDASISAAKLAIVILEHTFMYVGMYGDIHVMYWNVCVYILCTIICVPGWYGWEAPQNWWSLYLFQEPNALTPKNATEVLVVHNGADVLEALNFMLCREGAFVRPRANQADLSAFLNPFAIIVNESDFFACSSTSSGFRAKHCHLGMIMMNGKSNKHKHHQAPTNDNHSNRKPYWKKRHLAPLFGTLLL